MRLPDIRFTTSEAAKADALAIGWLVEESKEGQKRSHPAYAGRKQKEFEELLKRLGDVSPFTGRKNETYLLRFFSTKGYPNTLLFGLGTQAKWTKEVVRQAGAAVLIAQKREKLNTVALHSESLVGRVKPSELNDYLQAFCEGYLLANYEYKDLKKPDASAFQPEALIIDMKSAALEKVALRARALANAVNFARSLGDRPGNVLTPTAFSELVSAMAKEHGLKCTVLTRREIEREKMGLFLGVAQGSSEEPRFIILEHLKGKKGEKPIALVGKGITFDSGGISLKPADRMEDMKYDMMGAAAVAGIFQALASLKVPRNVLGFIAATENMPGGRAQKPGDVQRSLSGKTVEIINTDAEGRLILADAIEYAQKSEPQALIDFATLTGAVVVALGSVTTGIMGNHRGLVEAMKRASDFTGERVWELPLYEEYEEDLKSNYADYRNSGTREAGSCKAGTFLKFFVDPKLPWVHCDIAGSAYHRKDLNYCPHKYGAGVMVRLTTHLLENWSPLK